MIAPNFMMMGTPQQVFQLRHSSTERARIGGLHAVENAGRNGHQRAEHARVNHRDEQVP